MGDCSEERMHPSIPHFFQPLIPGFLSKFSIPRSFQKYLERSGDHNDDNKKKKKKIAILRDRGGKFWQVKVVYEGDDNRQRFKDGWEKFCKDHSLKVGDFLVFKYHGNLIFDVSIFNPNACERQLSTISTTFETKELIGAGAKNSMKRNRIVVKPSKYPFCRMSVKSYWPKGLVYFPKVFSRENGLSNKRCEIMVIDEKDRSWSLLLRTSNRTNTYIAGWRPVHEANGLKTGDPVIFELTDSGKRPIMKFYTTIIVS